MIELSTALTFAAFVTFIVTSPGPNLFLVIRNTLGNSRQQGMITSLGICTAIMCHAVLSLIGVGAVIAASAFLSNAMKIIGAGYLIWLGIKSIKVALIRTTAPDLAGTSPKSVSKRSAFLGGFITNAFNPKPVLFYLAAFPQFLEPEMGSVWIQGLSLGGLHAAIAFVWYGGLSAMFYMLAPILSRAGVWKAIQGVSGVALVFFGCKLLLAQSPR